MTTLAGPDETPVKPKRKLKVLIPRVVGLVDALGLHGLRSIRRKEKERKYSVTEQLNRKIGREQQRRTKYLVGSSVSVFLAGFGFWVYRANPGDRWGIIIYGLISFLAATSIALIGAAQDKRWLVKRLEDDLRDKELEQELARTDGNHPGRRAEKLLSINQHQLRRYYEQNLSQSTWIFLVGVACLIGGLAIIGVTLWLLADAEIAEGQSKWVVAVVGAIGSVLTNYVAAVYLKMHAASTASLTGFHEKLVATHELFFANVLASRTKEDKRDEITCQIALAIVQNTRRSGALEEQKAEPGKTS
jgi:hypothetical protein